MSGAIPPLPNAPSWRGAQLTYFFSLFRLELGSISRPFLTRGFFCTRIRVCYGSLGSVLPTRIRPGQFHKSTCGSGRIITRREERDLCSTILKSYL